jgi:hypothetical protein
MRPVLVEIVLLLWVMSLKTALAKVVQCARALRSTDARRSTHSGRRMVFRRVVASMVVIRLRPRR